VCFFFQTRNLVFAHFSNHHRKFQQEKKKKPFLAFFGQKMFFSLVVCSFKADDDPNSSALHSKTNNNRNHPQKSSIMQGARQSDVFFGGRESGQDVRQSNVTAVQAVANIVKSSLGPVGLDKVYYMCFQGKKSTLVESRIGFFQPLSAARCRCVL